MPPYESVGLAALSHNSELVLHKYKVKGLASDDVKIRVLYCGICHSDVHQVNNDWHDGIFPMVPGHEIIGEVSEVGESVMRFRKGDIVGIGCMVDSCGTCKSCSMKNEQFCPKLSLTYNSRYQDGSLTYGGYGKFVTVNEHFVLRVPTNLNLPAVAPLLCAGVTVFSPMMRFKMNKPGFKLAVLGLGGLGHMAVKFGVKFGCDVTVITRSESKRESSLALGAKDFIVATDVEELTRRAGTFDGIIDTVCTQRDAQLFFNLLTIHGVMVCVGAPPKGAMTSLVSSSLIFGEKILSGGLIGNIETTQEMLDFCGKHDVVSEIELIKFSDVNDACKRLVKSDVRYRFVIDVAGSLDQI
ncbi:zinc-binding dehydrogenase family protein [Cryptosporidium andersoni]|uniref:Zinc-binding dehydrogenase family protein n=1 Tax=Cryptosporidium andersoni TaxID=117008 RepID=A0A1J4MYV5_9CRYT|nr:zinc-binding dehydrogenase family protein [Cryptosporidium andersoni]